MIRRVLVVGGQGFFGRTLVEDLLRHTRAEIVVAGRRQRGPLGDPRLSWTTFDLTQPRQLDGFAAVVCSAGPYQGMPTALVEAAAGARVPYVDMADDRDFIARARRVRSPALQMVGLSAVPGLTCLLAGRARVGRTLSVRTFIAPGSRPMRGRSTLASLLSGLERWGAREVVRFPPPVGRRAVYRTIEVGDLDLVPDLFEGASFEFKVGFDLQFLSRGLGWARVLFRRGFLPDSLLLPAVLGTLVRTLSVFGTEAGAVQVDVRGAEGRYTGAVVARERGHRIPIVLAAIAVGRILEGRLEETRLDRWLPDLEVELARRGIAFIESRG